MKRLPLYTERRSGVELVSPANHNPGCQACDLHSGARVVCLPPEGTVGENTLLVVGTYPTRDEDTIGVAFSGDAAQWLRMQLEKMWNGPVVYTYGIRCAAGSRKPTDTMVAACRPYLAGVVEAIKPARILAFGGQATFSLLNRKVPPLSARRGYAYLSNGAKVFMMPALQCQAEVTGSTGNILRNDFRREHLIEDLGWALTAHPKPPPWDVLYSLVETPEDSREAVERLRAHGSVTYDTEYSGPSQTEYFQVDTLAIAATGTTECYVWNVDRLDDPEVVAPLVELFADASIKKTGHNIKVDISAVRQDKRIRAEVRGPVGDTLIWRKLDDPDAMGRLQYGAELVGMGGHKEEMDTALDDAVSIIARTIEETQAAMITLPGMLPRPLEAAVKYPGLDTMTFAYGVVPDGLRARYCALDTVATSLLSTVMEERINSRSNLRRTWDVLLEPAARTIGQIERWGFLADRAQIENVGRFVDAELEKRSSKLRAAGCPDPAKREALTEYLYGTLRLPILETTATGLPSVAADVLEKLRDRHPVIESLLTYKEYDTIRSRYAWNLLDHIRGDGRIHGSFNITGTTTGRFSSSDPNMQNIPSRSPVMAKMVKNIFRAAPGWRLAQIDYSQLEYRVAALLSGDKVMCKVFQDGLDLHRRTAELISSAAWGIPQATMEGYDKDQIKPYRSAAKSVNFGTLYGLGAGTLAKDLGISKAKAKVLIASIMGEFGDLDQWVKTQIARCRRDGYVYTYFDGEPGRWRPLWDIAGEDEAAASTARNSAINSPVQGSAAEYMLRSLNEVVSWLVEERLPARVVCTVHDSMILEIREDWFEDIVEQCVAIMESWWSGDVPIVADVEAGPRWGQLVEVPKLNGELQWTTVAA